MKCPNINSPEYKAMSKAIGHDIAHSVFNKNNGHFLDHTPDGNPSELFASLERDYGTHEAIRIKSLGYGTNFNGTEPTMQSLIRQADPVLQRTQMNVRSQAFLQYTLEKVQKAFSGFNVNFVVDEDVEGGVNANKKGWVEDGTLNYNLDRISYDTLIHEPFHIYMHVMETRDPLMVAKMRSEAQGYIDTQHPLAMAVKEGNPELAYDELIDEVLVTIAGLSSRLALLNTVGKINAIRDVNELEQMWTELEGSISEATDLTASFYHTAFDFDSHGAMAATDFQTGTIWQIGEAFSQDVFTGRVNISKEEMNIAYRTSFAKTSNQRDFRLHPNINTTKDFIPYLNNNTNQLKALDMLSDDGIVRYLMSKRTSDNIIHFAGEEIQLMSTETDALRAEIAQKILPMIKEYDSKTNDQMILFLNSITSGETFDNAMKVFNYKEGYSKYTPRILTNLLNSMGLSDGAQVMKYSDMKDSPNELVRQLHDEAFEGYDPLVVVHQVQDANGKMVVDVSIVDVTSMPLGSNGLNLNGRNLFSSVMDDRKAIPAGVEMTNSDGSFRQLSIGMTIMLMKQKMIELSASTGKEHDVKFRSLGVINPTKNSIDIRMVPDVKELIQHVKILREMPFMNKVSNDAISKVLNDESLYDADYYQSFVAMMQQYLSQKDGTDYVDQYDLEDMMSGDPEVMLSALQKRQRHIESRMIESARMNDQEYLFISGAIAELKFGFKIERNSLKDMNIMGKHITSTHNVRSMLVQEVVRQANTASQKVYDKAKARIKPFEEGFKHYRDLYESTAILGTASKFVVDQGSEYFKHLYKKRTVRVDDGDGLIMQEVYLPELHWDKDNYETKEALANGLITEEDIAWAEKLVTAIEEQYIENIYEKNKFNRRPNRDGTSKYTMEQAKKALYESGYIKGVIPVIKKSISEQFFDGNVKGASKQFADQMGRAEDIYIDNIQNEEITSEVSDRFAMHRNSENSYLKAGLSRGENGEFLLINQGENDVMSMNLEKIYRYFVMSSVRKAIYENEVLPYVNNANTLMYWMSAHGMKQDANQNYLREYVERLVHMKTQDTGEQDTVFGLPIRLSKTVRTGLGAVGFLAMGYRPWLGIKSHVFNETQGWMTALAHSLTDSEYFGISDYRKAHDLVFSDFDKVKGLSDMFHVVNGTENDLLNNPDIVITDKNIANSQYSNYANYLTDIYARRTVMVAQMLKEGTYDAYSYNEETGEIEYDETLDERIYEDGEMTPKGKAIRTFIKNQLIEDGIINKEHEGDLPRGHDYQSTQLFKYLTDKYVIGSMDNKSRSMIGNHYLGALASQFKIFSIDRLWNFGIDANTRKSIFGGNIKTFTDDNGNIIAKREIIEIEGQLQSLGAAIMAFKSMKDMPMSEWWAQASDNRRANLAKLGIKVATFAMLYALVKNLWPDDKNIQQKLAWLYTDILDTRLAYESVTQAPALVSQVDRLVDIVLGKSKVENLLRFVPLGSAIKDADDAWEFINNIKVK